MIIRLYDPNRDALQFVEGVKDFISRMDFTECLPKTDEKIIEGLGTILASEQVEVAIAEHEDQVVGILMMAYFPHMWNPDMIQAEEMLWWAAESAPKTAAFRLLKFVKQRAKEKGAHFMTFTQLTSSPEGVGRVYERMGMRKIETTYSGLL